MPTEKNIKGGTNPPVITADNFEPSFWLRRFLKEVGSGVEATKQRRDENTRQAINAARNEALQEAPDKADDDLERELLGLLQDLTESNNTELFPWFGEVDSFKRVLDASPPVRVLAALEIAAHLHACYLGGNPKPEYFRYMGSALCMLLNNIEVQTSAQNIAIVQHLVWLWGTDGLYSLEPFKAMVRALNVHIAPSAAQRETLLALAEKFPRERFYRNRALFTLLQRVWRLCGEPTCIDALDQWSICAEYHLRGLTSEQRRLWQKVFDHCRLATKVTPSAKWLTQYRAIVADAHSEFRVQLLHLVSLYITPQEMVEADGQVTFKAEAPCSTEDTVAIYLRGLLWALADTPDRAALDTLVRVAIQAFVKIKGIGARSMVVGNAAVACLAAMDDPLALGQLIRIRDSIKYEQPKAKIGKVIAEFAKLHNVQPIDIEESTVPDCDLDAHGKLAQAFGGYRLVCTLDGHKQWYDGDGAALKSQPASVKKAFAKPLKAFEKSADDARAIYQIWRRRFEGWLREPRVWTYAQWHARFIEHPLLKWLASGLIWQFEHGGRRFTALALDGKLLDSDGNAVQAADTDVRLWHPVEASAAELEAWRARVIALDLVQPFKQVFREIYTADTNAANHFANRLVRQKQFAVLAKERGWIFEMIGPSGEWCAPNDPYRNSSIGELRFTVTALEKGAHTDTGYYHYLITGELQSDKPLTRLPAREYSEAMRDIDLLATVCAVAEEAPGEEVDQSLFADYFNASPLLSGVVETRRDMLERMLKEAGITANVEFGDRDILIRGKLHRYRLRPASGAVWIDGAGAPLDWPRQQSEIIAGHRWFQNDPAVLELFNKVRMLIDDSSIKDKNLARRLNPASLT